MLRDEPTLRPGLYQMPEQPIGPRALIPAFRQATEVRGAFGWFSVGWISRVAPGLAVYLNREDRSEISFTIAPQLYPREREAVEEAVHLSPQDAMARVASVFIEGRAEANALATHALDCLAWMLATGELVLRVAVPHPWSNYHPKLWWFSDGLEEVIVRGSGNATSRGVYGGVEHMDVDVSWDSSSQGRIKQAVKMLNDWTSGRGFGIESVHDLDEAVREKILKTAPESPPTEEDYLAACAKVGKFDRSAKPSPDGFSARKEPPRLEIPEELNWKDPPYEHQFEAVKAWNRGSRAEGGELRPERGIIAMATGAGKTITALICATEAQNRRADRPFLLVVSAPSSPLIRQWREEVRAFDVEPAVPTLSSKPTTDVLTNAGRRVLSGGTHVILVTNHLLCTSAFQQAVRNIADEAGATTMLIADEAHTLGAQSFITKPPSFFELRLGLSATPERQYDPDGTEELFSYFGDTVYEFGLGRAIGFCLVPYRYYVHGTFLDGEELAEFVDLSTRIGTLLSRGEEIEDEHLTRLLIQRRRIVETAEAKIRLVHEVLLRRNPASISHALMYASSKNPEQFDSLKSVLSDLGIIFTEVTERQSGNDKLLGSIFDAFQRGDIQLLLAKKVLDEGVDIPSIREAFIVASSTVEREWIQRRGRVLRKAAGKDNAHVHDFLALPPITYFQDVSMRSVRRVLVNELNRALTFARHAENAAGADGVIAHLGNIREAFWSETNTASDLKNASYFLAPDTPSGSLT